MMVRRSYPASRLAPHTPPACVRSLPRPSPARRCHVHACMEAARWSGCPRDPSTRREAPTRGRPVWMTVIRRVRMHASPGMPSKRSRRYARIHTSLPFTPEENRNVKRRRCSYRSQRVTDRTHLRRLRQRRWNLARRDHLISTPLASLGRGGNQSTDVRLPRRLRASIMTV